MVSPKSSGHRIMLHHNKAEKQTDKQVDVEERDHNGQTGFIANRLDLPVTNLVP